MGQCCNKSEELALEARAKFLLPSGELIEFVLQKKTYLLGRSQDCDLVVPFEGFSRRHCKIELCDEGIFITDLSSTNGVIINDERIPPQVRTAYLSSLSLSIGPAVSVVIEELIPRQIKTSKKSNIDLNTGMRTSDLRSTSTPIAKNKKFIETKQSSDRISRKPKSWIYVFLLVLLLVVLANFFLKDQKTSNHLDSYRMNDFATDGTIPTIDF